MPLKQDQLDDLSFDDLVSEGIGLLPSVAPEWTDFNASDPGITFLELFAYFSELLIFQAGQLTPQHIAAFLKLLTAHEVSDSINSDEATQQALLQIRRPQRAVTCADYEELAFRCEPRVARSKCVPHQNLAERNNAARNAARPGHVSIVLVTTPGLSGEDAASAIKSVEAFLNPRRILTTRVHVVAARRVAFEVRLSVIANPGVASDVAVASARNALQNFFDPLTGGPAGTGWPMGRHVFISEIYHVVSRLDTTDHVTRSVDDRSGARSEELSVAAESADRLYRGAAGDLIGLRLGPDELPGVVTLSLTGVASALDLSREV